MRSARRPWHDGVYGPNLILSADKLRTTKGSDGVSIDVGGSTLTGYEVYLDSEGIDGLFVAYLKARSSYDGFLIKVYNENLILGDGVELVINCDDITTYNE